MVVDEFDDFWIVVIGEVKFWGEVEVYSDENV